MGAGTLWQYEASGCARGWRCTVRSLLCRPRLASSLSAPAAGKASELPGHHTCAPRVGLMSSSARSLPG